MNSERILSLKSFAIFPEKTAVRSSFFVQLQIPLFSILIFFSFAPYSEGLAQTDLESPADIPEVDEDSEIPDKTEEMPDYEFDETSKERFFQPEGFIREAIQGSESSLHPSIRPQRYPSSSRSTLGIGFLYEKKKIKIEIQGRGDYVISNYTDSKLFDSVWNSRIRNRLFYMEHNQRTDSYFRSAYIHRMSFTYNTEKHKISIGRQAISWGQGRFLNPLDLVTAVGPFIIDLEDIPGADAVNYTYYLSSMNMLEGVIVPYRRYDRPNLQKLYYKDTNSLMRFKATAGNLDYFIVAGYHFHSWVAGFDLNYTAFGASFRFAYLGRAEENLSKYQHYVSDDLPPSVSHQAVLGASYTFFKKLRTNFEIFGNSAYYSRDPALKENAKDEKIISLGFLPPQENDSSYFRTSGRIITKNPVLIEASFSFEATDLLNLSLLYIGDPVGKSAMYGPGIGYSLSDESIIQIGGWTFILPADREKAEFGDAEPMAYAFLRWHF